jgi:hypothetical protein
MPAPAKVLELMGVFERHADDYSSPGFNEAMLRQQFINPFFKSRGWDMENDQGHAEAYKDVIHEASIKIGGAEGHEKAKREGEKVSGRFFRPLSWAEKGS